MAIRTPTKSTSDPQRFSDCREALEPYVRSIIALAVECNWGEIEAAEAILALAEHHMIAVGSNADLTK